MRVPKIGITSSVARRPDGALHASVAPYVRAVERAGGEAVLLPNDASRVGELLEAVQGVVLSGGVDVDPTLYGGRLAHSRSERDLYRPERDSFEGVLVRATRDGGVPTLCICRGLQIANVAFGGTLIEDLRDELGAQYIIEHRQTDSDGCERTDYAAGHTVTVADDSALARLTGTAAFATNSLHHQAARSPGDGLVAVGHTSDGIVEALDATFEHPFFFAVQWHPEELDDAISAALFNGVVDAAQRCA